MKKINLYSVFYLNQMFSAISIKNREVIVKRCYWPLLNLIEKGIPLGVQISGKSLEIINKIDPDWIKKLKELLAKKKCELVGNGYAQIISPLIPAKVNYKNQEIGLNVYKKLLGTVPKIATINEMVYSAGIVESYVKNNYKAIMMEWNNPRKYHPEWKDKVQYHLQRIKGTKDYELLMMWTNSFALQKFQRYIHGDATLKEYLNYLEGHRKKAKKGYLCMYASDTEIFDFRPGRYFSEATIKHGEWDKIEELYNILMRDKNFDIVLPSEILKEPMSIYSYKKLKLESEQQPIPVKKQEKYTLFRWALTGRNDLNINTKCYSIYNYLEKTNNKNEQDWKALCYFWSSDFRTHIEEDRWKKYIKRLNQAYNKTKRSNAKERKKESNIPLNKKKIKYYQKNRYLIVETQSLKCVFNQSRGMTIDSLTFKQWNKKPFIGTLPHGYYEDISYGADFYSGHSIIERPGQHKLTDIEFCKYKIYETKQGIKIKYTIKNRDVEFMSEYSIHANNPLIEIKKKIVLPKREMSIFRPIQFTFIPTTFNKKYLFFATHNGGEDIEKFYVGKKPIMHSRNISILISAKYGLGATKGKMIIGDNKNQLEIYHDQTKAALIPSIIYDPIENKKYFFRIQYSAQEMDESFRSENKKQTYEFLWKLRPLNKREAI